MIGNNKIAPSKNRPPLKKKMLKLGAATLWAINPLPQTNAVKSKIRSDWNLVRGCFVEGIIYVRIYKINLTSQNIDYHHIVFKQK
jgi:hypothetical protein